MFRSPLQQLIEMGFPRAESEYALRMNGDSVQAAMDYMLAFPGQKGPTCDARTPSPSAYPSIEPVMTQTSGWGAHSPRGMHASLSDPMLHSSGRTSNTYVQHEGGVDLLYPKIDGVALDSQQTFVNPMMSPPWGPAAGAQTRESAEHSPPVPPRPNSALGVAGLVQRESTKTQQTQSSLQQAFQDLGALMTMAQEMVQLAEKFRASLQQSGAGAAEEATLDADLQQDLIALGISTPVTRESAGSKYPKQLATQLGTFLTSLLERRGGMMTVPDVYCLFNRARGTELVSPEDLMQAVHLLPKVGSTLRYRMFPSGISVIQSEAYSDEMICTRLVSMAVDGLGGVSDGEGAEVPGLGFGLHASDVAVQLGVSVTLAREYLLLAESSQLLCRDEGPAGTRFYRNFFRDN